MKSLLSSWLRAGSKPSRRETSLSRCRQVRPQLEWLEGRELMSAAPISVGFVGPYAAPAATTGTAHPAMSVAAAVLTLSNTMAANATATEVDFNENVSLPNPPFNIQIGSEVMHVTQVEGVNGGFFIVQREVNGVLQAHNPGDTITILQQQSTLTTALALGEDSMWITQPPTGLNYSALYKVQIDQEQLIVQPSPTSSDWYIMARGVDGTLEQSHAAGASVQFLGTSSHDAGWDFTPNQPNVDITQGTAKVNGPELVLVPGQSSKIATVKVDGYSHQGGDLLEVIIPQVTANQVPANLPNGININPGHTFNTTVVSQEDPSNILDGNQPMHSIPLMFSAVSGAPAGVTPIEVIVRQAGTPDIDLFLNLVVEAPAVPATPSNFTAKALSSTQIGLSWTPVSGATSYVINQWVNGAWQKIGTVTGGSSTGCTVNVSQAGTTYYFEVAAANAEGTGTFSAYQSVTTPSATSTVPGVPANFAAKAISATQVGLSWSAVSGATSYVIDQWVNGAWQKIGTVTGGSSTSCTINVSQAGTTYYFEIAAANAVGTGTFSAYQTVTTPSATSTTVPGVPANFAAKAISATQVGLSWSAVSGATSYVIDQWVNGAWQKIGTVTGGSSTSCTINVSQAGTTYYFEIAAANAVGTGTFSAYQTVTTPSATSTTVPGVPANFAAKAISATQIGLSWTAVSGATSHVIDQWVNGAWQKIGTVTGGSSTGCTVNVSQAGTYYFEVAAANAVGTGNFTAYQTVTT